MKALSIQQPYAWAIVNGYKPVENRTWSTKFRGPILIHAGGKALKDEARGVLRQVEHESGEHFEDLVASYRTTAFRGGIVGAAVITDCVTDHTSDWFYGPYGFVLEKPIALDPVALRGRLGFFNVPQEVVDKIDFKQWIEEAA